MSSTGRTAVEFLLTGLVGALVIAGPVYLDSGHHDYGSFGRNVIEGFKPYSLGLIAATGFAAGFFGRAHYLLLGTATVAALPLWSILDMAQGHEHNLFPFEFAFFGLYALIGAVGARLGRKMKIHREGTPR